MKAILIAVFILIVVGCNRIQQEKPYQESERFIFLRDSMKKDYYKDSVKCAERYYSKKIKK